MSAIVDGNAFAAGLALGSASVLSIGPNSLMMIREGLARGRTGLVATVVFVSYLLLLSSALATAGILSMDTPYLKSVLSWIGLTALLWFAVGSFRSALRSSETSEQSVIQRHRGKACVSRILKVVWTNPLTYIEFLIAPSTLCAAFGEPVTRAEFVLGMLLVIMTWCYVCTYGSRLCAPLVRHRRTLQIFDFVSGLLLSFLALSLAIELVA